MSGFVQKIVGAPFDIVGKTTKKLGKTVKGATQGKLVLGGKRRRRSRSRRRRKSRKSRKSKRRRKSKKGGRRKRRRTKRRTGTLNTLANPPMRGGSTVSYGAGFPKSTPWSLGPVSIQTNKPSCFDNYSHGKK